MLEALEENDHRGLSPSDVAIMPRDLAVPISKENAAFVHKKTRRALLSKLKHARKLCGLDVKPEAWKRFLERECCLLVLNLVSSTLPCILGRRQR